MAGERNALDRALLRAGTPLTLRRRVGTSNTFVSVPFRGVFRGYAPVELVGSITQDDMRLIASPTDFLEASDWPGAAGGSALPQKGDQVVYGGRNRTVQASQAIQVGTDEARIEAQVRG